MKSQEENDYDERVKTRVLILRDLMEAGKIHIVEGMNIEESLLAVRYDENGEPDLSTVDSLVRSMALMAENFDYREKMKSAISLLEVQSRYFSIIEANFGFFYQKMVEHNLTPNHIAGSIAYGNQDISSFDQAVEPFIEDIEEFWKVYAEAAYFHIEEEYESFKAIYGGDLFPTHNENIASKCGVYTDTIVLPCPYIRTRDVLKRETKQQRVYYLFKHALNILQYKDLALADVEKPIVVILPDREMMDEFSFQHIASVRDQDALYHASKIFGRSFESIEHLQRFSKRLNTIEKFVKAIKDPTKVLFDVSYKDPLDVQLKDQLEGQFKRLLGTDNPGLLVATVVAGKMGICNELLMKSARVGGVPLIDAPTSWEYFKWKLQYDAERTFPERDYSQLHVVKGLNGLTNSKLSWVGKIPSKGLIELRKTGAINEIRAILSKGIDELVTSNPLDFRQTSHKVFNNLNFAFNQHQENIKELTNKKWKIAGKDFGSWLVMGTVEIASACIGTPLYGVSTVVLNQIIDAPKLKDLPKSIEKIKDVDKQKEQLSKSPIGLMFNYSQKQ